MHLTLDANSTASILEVNALSIQSAERLLVDQLSFELRAGQTLALVGESGSGKSISALALMGLLPKGQSQIAEQSRIRFEDKDLLNLSAKEMRKICGKDIAMIFQEPMSSLNPVFTVGDQEFALPLALRGVRVQAASAAALLRRNLLIYGLGGLLVPFAGIKAIDMLLTALHLV